MELKAALIVGLGSFFGGSLRYLSVIWIDRKVGGDFPLAILCVNVVGSFLIGLMTQGFARYVWMHDAALPLFLTVGLLGGYTTFSTFSLQTLKLLQEGNWTLAALNVAGSVIACVLFAFAGIKLGQAIWG